MIQIVLCYHLDHLCNNATNLMFSNNYCYIQLNYTLTLQHLYILHFLFDYYLISLNGAQLLNITPLFLSSNRLAASSSPAPVLL